MLLVLDNGSVFTQNLLDLLYTKRADFEIRAPGKLEISQLDRFDSFILSGRRKNDQKMNALNSKTVAHAASYDKPLLGICYGAEILALALGCTIRPMGAPRRGMETVKITDSNPLCTGTISVFESHSFEIAKLGDSMASIGRSAACKNELIHARNSRIFGTQFHPEMSGDGCRLVEKFLRL